MTHTYRLQKYVQLSCMSDVHTQFPQVDQHVYHKQSVVRFVLGDRVQPEVQLPQVHVVPQTEHFLEVRDIVVVAKLAVKESQTHKDMK